MTEKRMVIQDIADALKKDGLLVECFGVNGDETFGNITYDSRKASCDSLFICKGIRFDDKYLLDAVDKGVRVYVSEKRVPSAKASALIVNDVRKALALISNIYYGFSCGNITLSAVTGTKGKSTTVYYLKNIYSAASRKCAYATTVDIFDGENKREAVLTTPESDELHKLIRAAKDNGCSDIIIEASSQAAKMNRIYGLEFDFGIYLNISDDHISPNEHKDFEEYLACKMEIISKFKNAVLNMDDEHFSCAFNAAKNAEKILTYSYENNRADFYAKDIRRDGFITYFTVVTPIGEIQTHTLIPGAFNVSNAVAAAAAAYMNGADSESIAAGIARTKVSGRMDIYLKNGYTVVVDYAHNKTSLYNALNALKEYYPDKNIKLVFGCPGGKGLQRRHDMAYIASMYAAYVYVTSEDPSYEEPMDIAREIVGYLDKYGCAAEIITDRKEAVKKAVQDMKKSDIIIIAGKGGEHYQIVGGIQTPYESDTALAEKYINEFK